MQKSFYSKDKFQKTASSHFKRYSDQDFKTTQIDKLLITQTHLFSHPKIRSLKTKLPQISNACSLTPFNSQNTFQLQNCNLIYKLQTQNLKQEYHDPQDIKNQATVSSSNLKDRLNKMGEILSNKVERLSMMVEYTMSQDQARTDRIQKQCAYLQQNNGVLKNGIDGLRQRMKQIELMMGVYTGEDKHLL